MNYTEEKVASCMVPCHNTGSLPIYDARMTKSLGYGPFAKHPNPAASLAIIQNTHKALLQQKISIHPSMVLVE
uniref:Cytochrome b5 domain-containing protein RLF isoform X2 n=1 Tax=Rhizophora mucronata TaxID=61149 RepID=A0A2P2KT04_RHIMU